jgi:hypothetical protein
LTSECRSQDFRPSILSEDQKPDHHLSRFGNTYRSETGWSGSSKYFLRFGEDLDGNTNGEDETKTPKNPPTPLFHDVQTMTQRQASKDQMRLQSLIDDRMRLVIDQRNIETKDEANRRRAEDVD